MALKSSIIKSSRQSKLNRLGGALAVKAAKDAGDVDVEKMKKYKQLWLKYKARVNRKYGNRGLVAAKKY